GRRLWSFQTDGGVNAPSITFMHEGTQYLAVYAGGAALNPTRKSDGLWLFSLEGTMEELPPGSGDPAGQFAQPQRVALQPPAGRAPDLADGRAIYARTCIACHGETGQGGPMGGAPLTPAMTEAHIMTVMANGQNTMPAFATVYSEDQMHDVAAYILQDLVAEEEDTEQ